MPYRSRPSSVYSDADTDTETETSSSTSSGDSITDSDSSSFTHTQRRRAVQTSKHPRPLNVQLLRLGRQKYGCARIPHRILYKADCCCLQPSPSRMCNKMFGTENTLAKSFWSYRANERAFEIAADDVHDLLHDQGARIVDKHVTVMVRCRLGCTGV